MTTRLGDLMRFGLVLVAVAMGACASSSAPRSQSTIGAGIDLDEMQPHEAARIVDEFAAKYGIEPPVEPPMEITSMADVRDVIRADRLSEYDAARRFSAGKHGAEALTVRASLELSQADAMLTVAAILEEQQTQALTEIRQLTGPHAYRGASDDLSRQDNARAEALRVRAQDLRRVVAALGMLAEEPIAVGSDLAKQAVRHDSRSQLAYLVRADSYRLESQWLEFDRMMQYADDLGESSPVKTHLRAMEAVERYEDRTQSRVLLRRALAEQPDLVRAQAHLVLVSEDVADRYAELGKLKALSPEHIVVRLAGPMIVAEYQTIRELGAARGAAAQER